MIYEYNYIVIFLEMATRVFLHVQGSVAQDVNLFSLCLVPPYLVRGGVQEFHSVMKMYTHITCQIP
jgi:hypothetical protein